MRLTFIVLLVLLGTTILRAQEDEEMEELPTPYGIVVYGNYNLYNWHQEGTHSVGQALNVLPGIGAGFWVEPVTFFRMGVEVGADFFPFSFDTHRYGGMGAVSFSGLLRLGTWAGVRGIYVPLTVAAGVQVSQVELYNRPTSSVANPNWNLLYIGEVALGVGTYFDEKSFDLYDVSLFLRAGGNQGVFDLSLGMRLNLTSYLPRKVWKEALWGN